MPRAHSSAPLALGVALAASVLAGCKGGKATSPPAEKMDPAAIPDAPVAGALKGATFDGKMTAYYYSDRGALELRFSDGKQQNGPCFFPEGGNTVKLEVDKAHSAVGKSFSAAYGSKDPSIAPGKVYVGFGAASSYSNPVPEMIGYAIHVEKLETPPKGGQGKIKVRAAVLTRFDKQAEAHTPTWFSGTFEGPVCGF